MRLTKRFTIHFLSCCSDLIDILRKRGRFTDTITDDDMAVKSKGYIPSL